MRACVHACMHASMTKYLKVHVLTLPRQASALSMAFRYMQPSVVLTFTGQFCNNAWTDVFVS